MRKRSTWGLLAVLILAVAIAGCATTPTTQAGPTDAAKIAKQQSLYFMGWYKAQYQDAASMGALAQAGKLPLEQVKVYRIKRNLLVQAKPLIEAYDAIVAGGGIPSADREQEILGIINQFAASAGGGGSQ